MNPAPGRLVLLRTEQERTALEPALQALRDAGPTLREIDADAARALEPGLSPEAALAGAIHLPDAGAGNCRLFAQLLRQGTQGSGVDYAFNTPIHSVRSAAAPPGWLCKAKPHCAAMTRWCCVPAMASAALLPAVGLPLPMTAVYGYSVSAPVRESTHAPCASVVDVAQQISITRLGQRVRIAGGAELAGANAEHHTATLQRLYRTPNDWFPGGAQLSSGLQIWRGARTMLPDGAPMLGASGVPGLWLNTGHGANGWALPVPARAPADLIAQREPEVNLTGASMRRFVCCAFMI